MRNGYPLTYCSASQNTIPWPKAKNIKTRKQIGIIPASNTSPVLSITNTIPHTNASRTLSGLLGTIREPLLNSSFSYQSSRNNRQHGSPLSLSLFLSPSRGAEVFLRILSAHGAAGNDKVSPISAAAFECFNEQNASHSSPVAAVRGLKQEYMLVEQHSLQND